MLESNSGGKTALDRIRETVLSFLHSTRSPRHGKHSSAGHRTFWMFGTVWLQDYSTEVNRSNCSLSPLNGVFDVIMARSHLEEPKHPNPNPKAQASMLSSAAGTGGVQLTFSVYYSYRCLAMRDVKKVGKWLSSLWADSTLYSLTINQCKMIGVNVLQI